jgi:hypothetical protein
MSFSHGGRWKTLISKYIGAIPTSGEVSGAAEQSISGMPPPWIVASSAIVAKVGAAASDSQPAAPKAAARSPTGRIASPARPLRKASLISFLLRQASKDRLVPERIEQPLD